MSALKPRGVPVILDGVERHFLFTLNVIDAIQDETGKNMQEIMRGLTDEEKSGSTLKYLVTVLVNDEVERARRKDPDSALCAITMQEAGELIGMDNIVDVTAAVMIAYGYSLPEPEEDDPNRGSGQQSS